MWSTHYEATTTASPDAVWAALAALLSGTHIGINADAYELHGALAVGTELTVTPQGQEPMRSLIVECEPRLKYADKTSFGDLTLIFRHELAELSNGSTQITHTLEILGADADKIGPQLGPQISADFPETMAQLIAAAEQGVGQS